MFIDLRTIYLMYLFVVAQESAAAAEVDAGGGGAAAGAGPVSGASPLDRRILAAAATAHVRRLVDPYYVSASSVER